MFNTTHDAVLLILAAIYVVVALVRAIILAPLVAQGRKATPGVLTIPIVLALILAVVAVLW